VNKLHYDGTWEKMYKVHLAAEHYAHSKYAPWVQSVNFLPWHRRFMHDVETLIQDAAQELDDPDPCEVTLPFWNWAEDYGLNHSCQEPEHAGDHYVFTCERFGVLHYHVDGHQSERYSYDYYLDRAGQRYEKPYPVADGAFGWGSFTRWPEFGRRISPGTYAQVQLNVEDATDLSFIKFSEELERKYHGGPHGAIGGFQAGTFGTMTSMESPHDPIFFAHHGFIDKLWADWQKKKGGLKEAPAGELQHLLCPAAENLATDWADSRSMPGVKGSVDVSYKSRVEMSKEQDLMQLKDSAQADSKLQSAAYWAMRVSGVPECCHQGLAKIGVKTARAIIRPAPGGEDVCAVNFHNSELLANEFWCQVMGGDADGCTCEQTAQKIIDEKTLDDRIGVLHCEVEQPEAEEKRLCMALYPSPTCADNLFDKCIEHKIMHDGSFDGEEGLCISETMQLLVKDWMKAREKGWKGSLFQESTIEAFM
jgi:hypothetical protein